MLAERKLIMMIGRVLCGLLLFAAPLAMAQAAQPPREAGERFFAPYLDANELPQPAELRRELGTRFVTLAFITAKGGCRAVWPTGEAAASEHRVAEWVEKWRAGGGKVVLAFGGLYGRELAQGCQSSAALAAAYLQLIERYRPAAIDFDIEHQALDDLPSIARRSRALAAIARKHPALSIIFTLPATPKGLTDKGVRVLKSAAAAGARVDVVNLMAMDYGLSAPSKQMGANAIEAANAARAQLAKAGLKAKIGITPMIGLNDVAGESFTPDDAAVLLAYAQKSADVAMLSYWSAARDNGSCQGKVLPNCSGIAQRKWQFAEIFAGFR